MSVKARYLMYTEDDRSKAYRLDVENDGKDGGARFWVNGEPVEPSERVAAAVLMALTALDTSFGALMMERQDNGK